MSLFGNDFKFKSYLNSGLNNLKTNLNASDSKISRTNLDCSNTFDNSNKKMFNLSNIKEKHKRSIMSFQENSNSKNEKKIDLFHRNLKAGKISKRKNSSNVRSANLLECYNLSEKERYRLLLANPGLTTHCQSDIQPTNAYLNRSIYKKLIHYSPTKTHDDISFDSKSNQNSYLNKTEILTEKHNIPLNYHTNSSYSPAKVSVGYSRRISLSLDSQPDNFKSNLNNLNKYTSINLNPITKINNIQQKKPIEIIDMTHPKFCIKEPLSNIKSAQKRNNSQTTQYDENNKFSSIENFKKETNEFHSTYHTNKTNGFNRNLNELEKNWNEQLNKNQTILDAIYKKPVQKIDTLYSEEERYKLKKRQRLEKDRAEKELALKFSQQLQLDSNKYSTIFFQEEKAEEEEIEDEFPELQEEHDRIINNALINHPQDEVLINGFSINITRKDIQTLKGLNWLNDEIINFYMNLICDRSKENSKYENKLYAFTTFFYPKLLKDGFNSLKRWTRKVDIFEHDLILIPVHLGLHWTLAVIDFNCSEIRYYDSMNGNNNECLKALRNYLKDEYMDKKGGHYDLTNWNCIHVKDVPQQMNGSDCGMFACKYAEFVSRGKTTFNFNQSHMPYYRRRMIFEILNKKLIQ